MGSEGRLWAALAKVLEHDNWDGRREMSKRTPADTIVDDDDARVKPKKDQGGASRT